jgi:TonB family protein
MSPAFFSSFVWVLLASLAGVALAQDTDQARKTCIQYGFKDKTVSHDTCVKQVLQPAGSMKATAKPTPPEPAPIPKFLPKVTVPTPVTPRPPPVMPVRPVTPPNAEPTEPPATPVKPSPTPATVPVPVTPGATGAVTATGTAAQAAGPSASYGGRLVARIRPNITFPGDVAGIMGNPGAEVEVRADADGTIISRKLLKSSGIKAWDEAVLKAIDKTETLPRDIDGRVPDHLEFTFRPKD